MYARAQSGAMSIVSTTQNTATVAMRLIGPSSPCTVVDSPSFLLVRLGLGGKRPQSPRVGASIFCSKTRRTTGFSEAATEIRSLWYVNTTSSELIGSPLLSSQVCTFSIFKFGAAGRLLSCRYRQRTRSAEMIRLRLDYFASTATNHIALLSLACPRVLPQSVYALAPSPYFQRSHCVCFSPLPPAPISSRVDTVGLANSKGLWRALCRTAVE